MVAAPYESPYVSKSHSLGRNDVSIIRCGNALTRDTFDPRELVFTPAVLAQAHMEAA
jgi:hypothetical protein